MHAVALVAVLSGLLNAGQTLNADKAPSMLLNCARAAKSKGDRAATQQCIQGWATLSLDPQLPEGLEKEAQEALIWARTAGRLTVFASRLEGRIRVGIKDPAFLVGKVEVFAMVKGRHVRLPMLESGGVGRTEYRLPEDPDAEVRIELWMTKFSPEVLLRVSTLVGGAGSSSLPKAPDPKVVAEAVAKAEAQPEKPKSRPPDEPLSWWWIAAGALAAGLVGAVVWQETRF